MLAGLEQTRLAVRRSAGVLILVLARALACHRFAGGSAQTASGERSRPGATRRPERGRSSRRSARKARRFSRWPTRRWPGRAGRAVGFRAAVAERFRQGAARHVRSVHADCRRHAVQPGARRWCMSGRCDGRQRLRTGGVKSANRSRTAPKPRIRSTRFFRWIDAASAGVRTRRVEDQPRVFGRAGRVRRVRGDARARGSSRAASASEGCGLAPAAQRSGLPDGRADDEQHHRRGSHRPRWPSRCRRISWRSGRTSIGRNEITPAADRRFGRDEELIVVFLVYNPMVTPERQFDVRVDYHFFRKGAAGSAGRRRTGGASAGTGGRAILQPHRSAAVQSGPDGRGVRSRHGRAGDGRAGRAAGGVRGRRLSAGRAGHGPAVGKVDLARRAVHGRV